MSWKNHKKWHQGKDKELAAGEPIHRPAQPVPEPQPALAGQGNFLATIAVSPAIQRSQNLTAEGLQDALQAALEALVRNQPSVVVSVRQI